MTSRILCRGEVCLRGPCVFQGYYKRDDLTKEALDSDGWLHSGDIGAFNPNGTLRIIDRKKNLLKLAQGEYIAVEKVEQIIQKADLAQQVFVHGDSTETSIVAVVVVEPERLLPWAKEKPHLASLSLPELCAHQEVVKAVFEDVVRV